MYDCHGDPHGTSRANSQKCARPGCRNRCALDEEFCAGCAEEADAILDQLWRDDNAIIVEAEAA